MHYMFLPLKRFFDFRGRSRRKEYWLWTLFVVIASIVLSLVDSVLGLGGNATVQDGAGPAGFSYGAAVRGGWLANAFSLLIFIPGLAVSVRRLHDTDRTGWWLLMPMVPYLLGAVAMLASIANPASGLMVVGMIAMAAGFVGVIVLLVFMCLEGTQGPNRFGADPKDPANAVDLANVFS